MYSYHIYASDKYQRCLQFARVIVLPCSRNCVREIVSENVVTSIKLLMRSFGWESRAAQKMNLKENVNSPRAWLIISIRKMLNFGTHLKSLILSISRSKSAEE